MFYFFTIQFELYNEGFETAPCFFRLIDNATVVTLNNAHRFGDK